ncbi:endo-1,4-beta-xylanase [Flavobacterium sp. 5]|uniref:endo-1,4-beta-xylanase n=1 Tax=Flavobacterium sp. 5 TaxID=2035199 RepID=UPI000C2BC726|nr:endo-1,4-beta-xylanase [Flavobacterium sp. 5]PKB16404.1 endo-1,4-beta-xylanase [Flavobacterium sp. 5]
MKTYPFFLTLFATITFSSCYSQKEHHSKNPNLKDTFKKSFYIGTAINESQIEEKNTAENTLIVSQFNSITAENIMKSMNIHPQKEKYAFDLSDKFVAFGQKNKMFIHGHTLIWHSQLSPWIAEIKDSTELKNVMKDHISTIVSRYKGKIDSWDVVNEAVNDDGTLRKSVFLETLGEDYLAYAFQLAAKADPNADLYYNDYSMTNPAKREAVIKMVKKIQAKGIKIDGIGMQGHWQLNSPTIDEIEKSILAYSDLGVKVAFTELDISVLPSPWELQGAEISQQFENTPKMNPYPQSLPDSIQEKLAKRYSDIFKLFLKHKDKISRVTFWGVHDGQSWLNDWPIKGRTNYPLLFDAKLKPKKAYYSVINTTKK